MTDKEATFRERMLHLHGEDWVIEQEAAHAAKFPPKVTAEDVLDRYYKGPHPMLVSAAYKLAQRIADLENAKPDLSWVEACAEEIDLDARDVDLVWSCQHIAAIITKHATGGAK